VTVRKRFGRAVRGLKRQHLRNDAGVILVLWTFALTAMIGLLAVVIVMGNKTQTATNAQNAADNVAVAAAAQLLTPYCDGGCDGGSPNRHRELWRHHHLDRPRTGLGELHSS
jgi:hypothetical protein